MSEEGVSRIVYFKTDGGWTKLYTQEYVDNLQNKLQQKENIIKEVRKYIKEHSTTINFKTMRADYNLNMNELLEILDKEGK